MRRSHRHVPTTFCLLILAALSGCSLAKLNAYGAKVHVVEAPPQNCEHTGVFYGAGPTETIAMNNLRNVTGEQGSTHVVLSGGTVAMNGIIPAGGNSTRIRGLAYKCHGTTNPNGSESNISKE